VGPGREGKPRNAVGAHVSQSRDVHADSAVRAALCLAARSSTPPRVSSSESHSCSIVFPGRVWRQRASALPSMSDLTTPMPGSESKRVMMP
jgi:hypothetical protein